MTFPTDYPPNWYDNAVQMYAALIRSHTPFAQANYGDGEWATILGESVTNSQGETTTPELTEAMQRTLLEPARGLWYGANPGEKRAEAARAWIAEHNVDVPWIWKETLAAANVNGRLAPVFQALRTRDVILVGPNHLHALPERVFKPYEFMPVPDATAWQYADKITERLTTFMDDHQSGMVARRKPIVVLCAGHATNLIIHQILTEYRLYHYGMLDFGACLDPYVGVLSRKGYHKPQWPERMERNLAA